MYIYTSQGYLYLQDKSEIQIDILINIINTTYNEKIKIIVNEFDMIRDSMREHQQCMMGFYWRTNVWSVKKSICKNINRLSDYTERLLGKFIVEGLNDEEISLFSKKLNEWIKTKKLN